MELSKTNSARLRRVIISVFILFTTNASAGNLVAHKGFEACWRSAITKASFLSLIQSSIEGTQGCVPPQSGTTPVPYTVCGAPNCPGGVNGCLVTLHGTAASGNFGTGAFTGPGTADTLSVPITSGIGNCTMLLSGITFNAALQYTLTDDGNFGVYTAALATPTVSITNYVASGCPQFASLAAAQLNGNES